MKPHNAQLPAHHTTTNKAAAQLMPATAKSRSGPQPSRDRYGTMPNPKARHSTTVTRLAADTTTRSKRLCAPARSAQPSEPILFPKLRIHFADFPYLHASSGREALHLGDLLRISGTIQHENHSLPRIFTDPSTRTGHRKNRDAFWAPSPYLRLNRFHGVGPLQRKDNSSQGVDKRLRVRLRHRSVSPRTSAPKYTTTEQTINIRC